MWSWDNLVKNLEKIFRKKIQILTLLLTLEWTETGPGGESKSHVWSPARMPRPLQQLWQHLQQRGQVCGEAQWILMWLYQFTIWRALLQKRYDMNFCSTVCCIIAPTGHDQVIESYDLWESSKYHLLSLNFSPCGNPAYLLNRSIRTHCHCVWTLVVQLYQVDSNRQQVLLGQEPAEH